MNPVRLDHFMAQANEAYYANRDPFADFTTAPEISQIFGELLGAWACVVWQTIGRPDPVLLVEAGPGRGTLLGDALRVVRRLSPGFAAALQLHLVENSPRLRALQQAALQRLGFSACWHDNLQTVPDGSIILLANEFLDALPIRQFRRSAAGWQECHVQAGCAVWLDSAVPEHTGTAPLPSIGGIVECNEAARAFTAAFCARLHRNPGAALLIDYGSDEPRPGGTLQALRDGAPCDPFIDPGAADLTAHVDFAALRGIASGLQVHGPVSQGKFLASLGLFERAQLLAAAQEPGQGGALIEAAHRLADPQRMGRLFKVMGLCSPSLATLPGFEHAPA